MSSKPTLGYWKIRGLAQSIRLALNYVEQEFEDKTYECGPAPDFSRECWFSEKFTLGLDFPNLPYYVDGDLKFTETNAILYHLGRKFDLCGKTEAEKVKVDMLLSLQGDLRGGFVGLCYGGKFSEKEEAYKKAAKEKLKRLADFLGASDYLAGASVTIADFVFYELLDIHKILDSTCLDDCPTLQKFCERVEALPTIKAYMESDRFMKAPLNNKNAMFG